MSGEYYSNEEPVAKYHKEYELSPKSNTNNDKFESGSQDHRLHEIEEQLEMAEDRCNTLKGQLDYMKQLYGVSRKSPKVRKISSIPSGKKSDDRLSGSSTVVDPYEKDSRSHLKRQNSNAISTDNTGAAVRTINNILNGITDSVNRLSELHVQISDTPRRKVRSTGVSPHPLTAIKITSHSNNELVESHKNTNLTADSGNLQDTTGDTSVGLAHKLKNAKRKNKDNKIINRRPMSSQNSIRKTNKIEKRIRNYSSKTPVIDKSVATIMKRRVLNSLKPTYTSQSQPHKLVEIYHNTAAKNSDSDEGNLLRKSRRLTSTRSRRFPESRVSTKSFNDVPPIEIPEKMEHTHRQEGEGDAPPQIMETLRSMEPPDLEPLRAPRTEISCYSKNYELPTIASRMKQVAKSYLNSFTFKAIPFCAAISTTPSHNIGINIQQVMNIIKNRQPIRGISPTLAHNIGLAAERLNSKPLSALVSTIHSKTGYRMSQCPLSNTYFNYPQLQELARGIPEETAEEIEEAIDSPEVKTIIITGPSGDMEVKNRNTPIWAADPTKSEQCTCVPQSGVDFQQVVNKYRRPIPCQTAKSMEVDNRASRSSNVGKKKVLPKKSYESKNGFATPNNKSNTVKVDQPELVETPLQGKERNLKEVLTNLHDEFEALNKKYEELSNKASAEDEETLKELENMEAELSKKEEEITMVMTLYKEVIALKQQIKSLKEKASQGSVNVVASDVKFKEYNNPQAAFHLTKLLRQIQHYQMRYKRDFSGP